MGDQIAMELPLKLQFPLKLQLKYHGKATIWLNDKKPFPDLTHTLYPEEVIATHLSDRNQPGRAALEILMPLGGKASYGLLGAKFIPDHLPNHSGKLRLEFPLLAQSTQIFEQSLAAKIDTVKIGLPLEYRQAVIDGVDSLQDEKIKTKLSSGLIFFDQAAYGEISSSSSFFRQLAILITKFLLFDSNTTEASFRDTIEAVIYAKQHDYNSR